MTTPERALRRTDLTGGRFAQCLDAQKARIARHALAAWDGESAEEINENLRAARTLLRQIAGTAASAGAAPLGDIARQCEQQIVAHLDGDYADLAVCPGEIIWRVDGFVQACDAIGAD